MKRLSHSQLIWNLNLSFPTPQLSLPTVITTSLAPILSLPSPHFFIAMSAQANARYYYYTRPTWTHWPSLTLPHYSIGQHRHKRQASQWSESRFRCPHFLFRFHLTQMSDCPSLSGAAIAESCSRLQCSSSWSSTKHLSTLFLRSIHLGSLLWPSQVEWWAVLGRSTVVWLMSGERAGRRASDALISFVSRPR